MLISCGTRRRWVDKNHWVYPQSYILLDKRKGTGEKKRRKVSYPVCIRSKKEKWMKGLRLYESDREYSVQ